MQRYYHIDLLDIYRPASTLTHRKLSNLIAHLPAESAYLTAVRDNTDPDLIASHQSNSLGSWSKTEQLLATVIDSLNLLYWQQSCMNRKKGTPAPKRPDPILRPGTESDAVLFKRSGRYSDLRSKIEEERSNRRRILKEQVEINET